MTLHELYRLARQQGGVFARWQAIDLGFSHYSIARRLEAKEWVTVVGGVLTPATSVLGRQSMEWAAYLACGRNSVLSGPSALGRHGLEVGTIDGTAHWVTIPPERHVRFPSVRTIREAVESTDIVTIDGMRVTSIVRSIVDTIRVVPDRIGRPVLDRALLRGWLTIEDLEFRTYALSGRRGVVRLRRHLVRVRGGARSEAERLLHAIIIDIPGWIANLKVVDDDGHLVAIVDAAFPKHKLAIEIDGLAFHTDPERFQHDRTRQNRLTALAWRVLRYTWDDLMRRPNQVKREILHELTKQDPTPRSEFRGNSEN